MKLEQALQLKDKWDREFRSFCEVKSQQSPARITHFGHDKCLTVELEKAEETVILDKRELERLMKKAFLSTRHNTPSQIELINHVQGCSACTNRLHFCDSCTEKASEFFSNFSSAELFARYGNKLPPADEIELAAFVESVNLREARAIGHGFVDA
ncbi:uncharacterized protein PHALS_13738 [Plasmopara halstedii]|uniref:Uncharacterized protein n=1 Tax=Plasmopara halstedii TaxID=4781 RepID=A0A0P1AQX2_PLAHL|nr:uncharacterized protein PHALS_13738 [Plasmopara halstedii]CEG43546.1 hypothetical protein PHALS_13738 [Plasmopara halstedii]|eukprot:XP_024579915.1 hypothetical protein PHALS_13738 [Plasmopara halstedii]